MAMGEFTTETRRTRRR